jgi:very-short-patch-repair endonuclease
MTDPEYPSHPTPGPSHTREGRKILFKPRPTARAQQLRNNATDAERHLWRHLSRRQLGGHKFSRQMPVGPFICDFMCREAALVVELDGGQHARDEARDSARTQYIEAEGFRVLRFWNNDVLGNTDGVLQAILRALKATPPPAPPASGRGES